MATEVTHHESGPARTDMADAATARSHIYGLLATVFRAEPSEAFLKEMKDAGSAGVFSDLGIDLGEEFLGRSERELADDLAVEYARLFLGPGEHISPHESVHGEVDGGDWGQL